MFSWLCRPANPAPAEPAKPKTDPASPVLAELAATRERITQIRSRADSTAKLIGAVAVALAGYLGIAKLEAIFPLTLAGDLERIVAAGFVVAVAMLVGGVLWWISLLERVGAPIALTTDPLTDEATQSSAGLEPGEAALVVRQFERHAKLNGAPSSGDAAPSLALMEVGILNAQREAAGLPPVDPAVRWRPVGNPDVLSAELSVVIVRAVADVVRHRYRAAFDSGAARTAMMLAATGYVGLALSTGYLAGHSEGQVQRAKSCSELVKAQLEAQLTPSDQMPACRDLWPGVADARARADAAAAAAASK